MPVFWHEGRCALFVHIPKTGGTSIEKFFRAQKVKVGLNSQALHGPGRFGFPCSPQHFHEAILSELFPAGFFDGKVAIIRNPVERMLSEYRHRMGILVRKGRAAVTFERWLRGSLRKYSKDPYFKDNHFRPQVDFLDDQTKLFRLEEGLDRPVEHLANLLEVKVPPHVVIPVKNAGPSVRADVSDECLSLIQKHYTRDFEVLGYDLRQGD